jgi:hypothetical protein
MGHGYPPPYVHDPPEISVQISQLSVLSRCAYGCQREWVFSSYWEGGLELLENTFLVQEKNISISENKANKPKVL